MNALLIGAGVAMAFTLFLTPLFIRLFNRLGWGQFIRDDGPQSHHAKRGTPTMGGIVFIIGAVVGYLVGHLVTGQPSSVSVRQVSRYVCSPSTSSDIRENGTCIVVWAQWPCSEGPP